jgi:hypothetical protein
MGSLTQIMDHARQAKLQLQSDGHILEASAVQRLLVSRSSSASLNKALHGDLARLRAILHRAHDAMSRRDPDGVSDAEWDQLVADMAKEIAA